MGTNAQKNAALAEIDASGVAARQEWRHWKGTVYTVTAVGLVEKTLEPFVTYAGPNGVVWMRTLAEFLEDVSNDVEKCPRFSRVRPWVGETLPDRCALSEDSCKAADCPEHGIFMRHTRRPCGCYVDRTHSKSACRDGLPSEQGHPMMPRPREGRLL